MVVLLRHDPERFLWPRDTGMKRATGNAETVPGTPRRYGGHLTNDKIVCKEHARYTWITEENKLKSSRL